MGIRGKLEEGKRRHEFQADHGFRKFFKTACERKMKSLYVEMLLGHNLGLGDKYYRPQESELLEEYLKAVPELTILESRPQTLKGEDIESLKKRISELEENQKKDHVVMERVLKLLEEAEVSKARGSQLSTVNK